MKNINSYLFPILISFWAVVSNAQNKGIEPLGKAVGYGKDWQIEIAEFEGGTPEEVVIAKRFLPEKDKYKPRKFKQLGEVSPLYPSTQKGKYILGKNGKSSCLLVLSDNPSNSAKKAADELRRYLGQIIGETPRIVTELNISSEDSRLFKILVGDSHLAQALGFSSNVLKPESYVLKTANSTLIVIGSDKMPSGKELMGTTYAAMQLLEKYMGVRWLWPGDDTGTVVQKSANLTLPEIDDSFTPVIAQRRMRMTSQILDAHKPEIDQKWCSFIGVDNEAIERKKKLASEWGYHLCLGEQANFVYQHAYMDYWPRFNQSHPEWFALQKDGTRNQGAVSNKTRAQLCVSNMELVKQVAEDKVATLKADPMLKCASISPNDGGAASYCLCDSCRLLDPIDGPKILLPWGRQNYVSLSNRYFTFYNRVADLVKREMPDRLLGAYAYSFYFVPPQGVKVAENIMVSVVAYNTYLNEGIRRQDQAIWDGWANSGAKSFMLRPNALYAGMAEPFIFPHKVAEDIKHTVQKGTRLYDWDGVVHNWASQGINYYVIAKLMWDPSLDVDAIIDDYCMNAFGLAASVMRDYFNYLEEVSERFAWQSDYLSHRIQSSQESLYRLYSPKVTMPARILLKKAKQQAENDSDILTRIAFIEKGLDYAEMRYNQKGSLTETKELFDFLKENGASWAINSTNQGRTLGVQITRNLEVLKQNK